VILVIAILKERRSDLSKVQEEALVIVERLHDQRSEESCKRTTSLGCEGKAVVFLIAMGYHLLYILLNFGQDLPKVVCYLQDESERTGCLTPGRKHHPIRPETCKSACNHAVFERSVTLPKNPTPVHCRLLSSARIAAPFVNPLFEIGPNSN
jgi:hypothetical protein